MKTMTAPLKNKISIARHRAIVSQRQSLHNGILITKTAKAKDKLDKITNRLDRVENLLSKLDGSDRPWYTKPVVTFWKQKVVLRRNKRLRDAYTKYDSIHRSLSHAESQWGDLYTQLRKHLQEEQFIINEHEISRVRESVEEQMKYTLGW
jgi:hypothetical protein